MEGVFKKYLQSIAVSFIFPRHFFATHVLRLPRLYFLDLLHILTPAHVMMGERKGKPLQRDDPAPVFTLPPGTSPVRGSEEANPIMA